MDAPQECIYNFIDCFDTKQLMLTIAGYSVKEIAKHGSLVREAKQTLEEIFVFNKE